MVQIEDNPRPVKSEGIVYCRSMYHINAGVILYQSLNKEEL